MHRILEAMSAYVARADPHCWQDRVVGMSRTHPVTRSELAEVLAQEERTRVRLEEQGAPISARVEQAALVSQLASALRNMTVQVAAYYVMTTYNSAGTFKPGQHVTWSGHLSREEAERCVPLWERHLTDNGRHTQTYSDFRVEYLTSDLYKMRKDGWEGPR